MGSSQCKGRRSTTQQARHGHEPTADRPLAAYHDTEPRVVLGNHSAYRISYWVVKHDPKHMRTKEAHDRFVGSMSAHLNGGNPCECSPPAVSDELLQEPSDTREQEEAYFLTRDHRMEPRGGTQVTKVPFPADCRKMQVYAFFRGENQWRLFHDKVYSIWLFRKVFTFIAADADMSPCISVPSTT